MTWPLAYCHLQNLHPDIPFICQNKNSHFGRIDFSQPSTILLWKLWRKMKYPCNRSSLDGFEWPQQQQKKVTIGSELLYRNRQSWQWLFRSLLAIWSGQSVKGQSCHFENCSRLLLWWKWFVALPSQPCLPSTLHLLPRWVSISLICLYNNAVILTETLLCIPFSWLKRLCRTRKAFNFACQA